MSHCVEPCGGQGFGGCGVGTNVGAILVLFILLVIIIRACVW